MLLEFICTNVVFGDAEMVDDVPTRSETCVFVGVVYDAEDICGTVEVKFDAKYVPPEGEV